ncbi:MAG: hypothetical protein AUK49_03620 [Betaproteobacteria bacterium CG2_30_68_42]|nr:MAG: hypothetical protein AUK49_03620 [Betaproteobacteria bacterium CG2_30_68_42]
MRCGRCRAAFNALEALDEAARAVPLPTATEQEPPAAASAPVDSRPETESGSAAAFAAQAIAAGEPHTFAADAGIPSTSEPLPRRRHAWLRAGSWSLAAVLLLALAIGQAGYFFRSELAVAVPSSKTWLEQACAALGCEVELPRRAELLSVEASDLRPHAGSKDQFALSATLRNRAPFAMEFPHLELTLTDTADRALARRVFPPREYLLAGENPSAGMPGQSSFQLSLAIEAASLGAAGYRLYVFYP